MALKSILTVSLLLLADMAWSESPNHPYLVTVYLCSGDDGAECTRQCEGAIVNDRFVVTQATCLILERTVTYNVNVAQEKPIQTILNEMKNYFSALTSSEETKEKARDAMKQYMDENEYRLNAKVAGKELQDVRIHSSTLPLIKKSKAGQLSFQGIKSIVMAIPKPSNMRVITWSGQLLKTHTIHMNTTPNELSDFIEMREVVADTFKRHVGSNVAVIELKDEYNFSKKQRKFRLTLPNQGDCKQLRLKPKDAHFLGYYSEKSPRKGNQELPDSVHFSKSSISLSSKNSEKIASDPRFASREATLNTMLRIRGDHPILSGYDQGGILVSKGKRPTFLGLHLFSDLLKKEQFFVDMCHDDVRNFLKAKISSRLKELNRSSGTKGAHGY